MTEEAITEVGIDDQGRLYVRPSNTSFDYVYRAGMEIYWDADRQRLYSPKPREWDHLRWFDQIVAAAAGEYGVRLTLGPETSWSNVPDRLRTAISAKSRS